MLFVCVCVLILDSFSDPPMDIYLRYHLRVETEKENYVLHDLWTLSFGRLIHTFFVLALYQFQTSFCTWCLLISEKALQPQRGLTPVSSKASFLFITLTFCSILRNNTPQPNSFSNRKISSFQLHSKLDFHTGHRGHMQHCHTKTCTRLLYIDIQYHQQHTPVVRHLPKFCQIHTMEHPHSSARK